MTTSSHSVGDARNAFLRTLIGEVRALDDVTVSFARGQMTAIMGPSGSGRSTLMHLLAGPDTPSSGTVEIGGEDITTMSDKQLTKLRRKHIGFVFQQFNLLPTLTAEENILLPLSIAGRKPDRADLEALIARVSQRVDDGLGEDDVFAADLRVSLQCLGQRLVVDLEVEQPPVRSGSGGHQACHGREDGPSEGPARHDRSSYGGRQPAPLTALDGGRGIRLEHVLPPKRIANRKPAR